MRTNAMRRVSAMVLALVFFLQAGAYAAESPHLDNIKRVLETSTLSRAGQADVFARSADAVNTGVPAEDVEVIVSRGLNRRADAGTINRFLDTGISVKQAGLPVGPVLDRIEQGLAKGVPPERIASASERLAQKLHTARPIVDTLIRGGMGARRSTDREDAMESAARALEKSIDAQDIESMGAAVQARRGTLPLFTSALDTAAYFAGSGMAPRRASELVRNSIERGYSERDMDGMIRRVAAEMRSGMRAEDAASRMERENMQGGRGMGDRDMQRDMMNNRGGGAGPGTGGMGGPRR